MAKGSQTWNGTWADFPIAPIKKRSGISVVTATAQSRPSQPRGVIVSPTWSCTFARISGISRVPKVVKVRSTPSPNPTSATAFTRKARVAAKQAALRSAQWEMSRYEQRAISSQQRYRMSRLLLSTSRSMAPVQRGPRRRTSRKATPDKANERETAGMATRWLRSLSHRPKRPMVRKAESGRSGMSAYMSLLESLRYSRGVDQRDEPVATEAEDEEGQGDDTEAKAHGPGKLLGGAGRDRGLLQVHFLKNPEEVGQ